jgi:hypothetical protein
MNACSMLLAIGILFATLAHGQNSQRVRNLSVRFDGSPGTLDAITDVKGVKVGNTTLT